MTKYFVSIPAILFIALISAAWVLGRQSQHLITIHANEIGAVLKNTSTERTATFMVERRIYNLGSLNKFTVPCNDKGYGNLRAVVWLDRHHDRNFTRPYYLFPGHSYILYVGINDNWEISMDI